MQKKRKLLSPKKITVMAMLIALQILLSRFLGIQVSEGLRISFETVPVIIAGLWIGPIAGLIVAFVSDILGTILSGYGVYFVPLAITPIINGVVPALIVRYVWKNDICLWKLTLTIVITEIISSMICGTYVLTWYYALFVPSKVVGFVELFGMRIVPKAITITCNTILVNILHFSMYKRVIQPLFSERR